MLKRMVWDWNILILLPNLGPTGICRTENKALAG